MVRYTKEYNIGVIGEIFVLKRGLDKLKFAYDKKIVQVKSLEILHNIIQTIERRPFLIITLILI